MAIAYLTAFHLGMIAKIGGQIVRYHLLHGMVAAGAAVFPYGFLVH